MTKFSAHQYLADYARFSGGADLRGMKADKIRKLNKEFQEVREQADLLPQLTKAVNDIKAEFNRLSEGAETVRDRVYLDGVIAVITAHTDKLINTIKEKGYDHE